MSGKDFNITTRPPAKVGLTTFEIFAEEDFINPTALPSGLYLIKQPMTLTSSLIGDVDAIISIQCEFAFGNLLTFTGTGVFFTGSGPASSISLFNLNLLCTGDGATVISYSDGFCEIERSTVTMAGADGTGKTIANISNNVTFFVRDDAFFGFDNGITVTDVLAILIRDVNFISSGFGASGIFRVLGRLGLAATFETLAFVTGPAQSAFFIEPDVGTFPIGVDRCFLFGFGTYFESGTTGNITLFTDVTPAPTVLVSTVGDFNGLAQFNCDASHGYQVGSRIIHSAFTNYANANQTVSVIISATSYLTGEANNSDDTGATVASIVEVTSVAHLQTNGTALLISGTIDYNTGFTISNVMPDTFEINAFFVTGEIVGTWDTGSLTETDPRVNVINSGAQKESMNVAYGEMNGNVTDTVVPTAATYQAMNLSGIVTNLDTERWTLIDAVAGVFRYDGITPYTGDLTAVISATKMGGMQNYRFTNSIDGAIPVFATQPFVPMEVKSTKVAATLIKPNFINPGQTVQVMVASETSTDNVRITDFTIAITT